MKSARENFLGYFFWFFSRAEIFFSPTFLKFFLGQFQVFSGTISYFFSGWLFFFSGRNLGYFLYFSGQNFVFFSRERFFFLGLIFAVFFSGTILLLGQFSRFFSRPLWKLLGQKIENFLGFKNFFLGKKKTLHCLVGGGGGWWWWWSVGRTFGKY